MTGTDDSQFLTSPSPKSSKTDENLFDGEFQDIVILAFKNFRTFIEQPKIKKSLIRNPTLIGV